MKITRRKLYCEIKKKVNDLDGDNDVKNTLSSQLGAFLLSNINEI